jgi:PIN domain nuclease of toxin-antitoxin system
MKILLDTQAFLWIVADAPELSKKAKKIFLDQENDLFLSLASIWEMAIKLSLGKLKLKQPIEKFLPAQLQENSILQLDISFRHVVGVASLPFHHRDPFDRLIISQAIQENLLILSSDVTFDAYNIQRLWQ